MATTLASSIRQNAKGIRQIISQQNGSLSSISKSSIRSVSNSSSVQNVSQAATATTSGSSSDLSSASAAASASLTSSKASSNLIEKSKSEALELLRSQPIHYVICSMVGKTLLLHERDLFTLPRLNDVSVGDVLELDRVHEIGSRDFTLRAQDSLNCRTKGSIALNRRSVTDLLPASAINSPILKDLKESQSWAARLRPSGLGHVGACLGPESIRVRCTVVEHTKGPMELIVKKKRRKGYKRTIRHKQTYTRLRVESILVGEGHL